ncbi:hypothetical protein GCK32_019349 [Trichostrongylus colubriformis]|uniref:Uncharacterized protein n=1 Tax=Trichostrongylus colubriformis TaxID=6319 RepID=A0AAN8EQ43_TRICO
MQDEPEDLSLPADERTTRLSFWSFVEQKKQIGEIVMQTGSEFTSKAEMT